jgi:hypothetical protein
MTRMLSFFIALIILNNCLWAQNNETILTDIQTINNLGTTSIQNYKGGKTYKAAISIDDGYKQDDRLDLLRLLLTDENGNNVLDSTFTTMEKQFSIDFIDLDNDGERDFIFIIRENDFRHIHQTLLIKRIVWQSLTEVLSIPYAGQTNEGVKWKYNHSYIRQEDGHFHIMLTPEQDISNKTNSPLPVKPVCINIGDKSGLPDWKQPEPNNPLKWYHHQNEFFMPNLLGNTGYTVRVINLEGDPNSPPYRDSLRAIQVVDKDGNVFSERPFRGYFGWYGLTLFDIDEDGDMEFFFLLEKGGTGYADYEISIDKIVNGQFIPLLTCPVAAANSWTGDWAFSEWKYREYGLNNPSNVAFGMVLNYSTSDRDKKEDVIPDSFPRADKMVILFEKDKYSINFIYSAEPGKRPLSRENDIGPHWGLPSGWSWGWIFK